MYKKNLPLDDAVIWSILLIVVSLLNDSSKDFTIGESSGFICCSDTRIPVRSQSLSPCGALVIVLLLLSFEWFLLPGKHHAIIHSNNKNELVDNKSRVGNIRMTRLSDKISFFFLIRFKELQDW